MAPALRPTWSRRTDSGELLEWFLVAAVVSVLGIRAFLAAAGYPRVGNGTLHIAHMLWGGALMLAALIVMFVFLDRRAHHLAAVVAGLGFGTFIDEIGKFVTADNDYFYRPALVLIYLVLVGLFLIYRAVATRRLSRAELLANAMDILEAGAQPPLDPRSRALALALLDRSDPADPLVPELRRWAVGRPIAPDRPGPLDRVAASGERLYTAAASSPLFESALVLVVGLDAVAAVAGAVGLVMTAGHATASETGSVSAAGQTISALVGAAFVVRGIPELAISRLDAYRWFRRGVVVWILVTQAFVFYISQLAGVAGLALDVVAYGVLSYMIGQELSGGQDFPADLAPREGGASP